MLHYIPGPYSRNIQLSQTTWRKSVEYTVFYFFLQCQKMTKSSSKKLYFAMANGYVRSKTSLRQRLHYNLLHIWLK